MHHHNPNWCWSSRAHLCQRSRGRHLGRYGCDPLRRWEEDEEEEAAPWDREHPSVCYYTGGDDPHEYVQVQRDWSWPGPERDDDFGPVDPVESLSLQGQRELEQSADDVWMCPTDQPWDNGESADGPQLLGGQWGGELAETHGCVCLHRPAGRWEAGGGAEQWTCSPFPFFGVRKTVLVGVEVDVVEELTIEDTEILQEQITSELSIKGFKMKTTELSKQFRDTIPACQRRSPRML